MGITIDYLNKSVVSVLDTKKKNTLRHARKRWYFKKNLRASKRVKTIINFLYETRKTEADTPVQEEQHNLFFVTITTLQHRTNFSDIELWRRIGLWFRNRKEFDYVCVVERQRNTQDLHFHVFIRCTQRFNIPRELRKLSRLLGTEQHPALLELDFVTGISSLVVYLNKYITKSGTDYSSLFTCRTFSISKCTTRRYKEMADRFLIRFRADVNVKGSEELFIEFIKSVKNRGLLNIKFLDGKPMTYDFFWIYVYSEELFTFAKEFRDRFKEVSENPFKEYEKSLINV